MHAAGSGATPMSSFETDAFSADIESDRPVPLAVSITTELRDEASGIRQRARVAALQELPQGSRASPRH
jgi:hypothetical protein